MELAYLIFDFSDEESGCGSFDAMASVLPDRVPALLAEVQAVLRWAHQAFGPPSAAEGDGGWDFDLHGTTEAHAPWALAYDPGPGTVSAGQAGPGRATLTLTIGGPRPFCDALRDAFSIAEL